jgi:hypothetical protein
MCSLQRGNKNCAIHFSQKLEGYLPVRDLGVDEEILLK